MTKRRRKSAWQVWQPWLRWLGLAAVGWVPVVVVAAAGLWIWAGGAKTAPGQMAWGFTFSSGYARGLGLDPHAAYTAMLDQLRPKRLRLIAYWTDIEPTDGQ